MPAERSQPGHGVLLHFTIKLKPLHGHATAFLGTNQYQPQCSQTLPERISMGPHYAGSLKFGVLIPSHESDIKHRSTVPLERQMARTEAE